MDEQKRTNKPWTRMTLAELREATKQYDREIPLEETKPLTPEEQREWDNLDRGPYDTRCHRPRTFDH